MSFLTSAIDERFWTNRQRATSLAGIAGGILAVGLFAWRFYVDHIWSWDLFAVVLCVVIVKMGAMLWFYLTQ